MKFCLGLVIIAATLAANAAYAGDKGNLNLQIASARSAAPPSVGAGAAVVTMSDHGEIKELIKGDNGWTCIVHDPGTPLGHPLCLDKNGLDWMTRAMSGGTPDPDKIGYSYMLKGGSTWSATDVTALALPAGQNRYIRIPPHVMIMNAKIANSSGFPSGETYPNTRRPFVMYGGTAYAIIIMPLN